MQIPRDKQGNSQVWFVHATHSSSSISHPLPVSLTHSKPKGRSAHLCILAQQRPPLCIRAAWKAVAAPACVHGGAECCRCTGLTPQNNPMRLQAVSCRYHAGNHFLPGRGGSDLYRETFSLRCFLQVSRSNDIDA